MPPSRTQLLLPRSKRPDLFSNLAIVETQPRLWVSALVIYRREREVIRKVSLRRGLNIVWSPDHAPQGAARETNESMGHSAGKTLFCRLLRFALGEREFGNVELRSEVRRLVPDGWVGIEAEVAGKRWVALRELRPHGEARALDEGEISDLFSKTAEAAPYERFLKAIERSLPRLPKRVQSSLGDQRWRATLAWLSRDQEQHFRGLRDWRSTWAASNEAPTLTWLSNFMRSNLRLRSDDEEIAFQKQTSKLRERRANATSARLFDAAEKLVRSSGLIPARDDGPLFRTASPNVASPTTVNTAMADVPGLLDLIRASQEHASAVARLADVRSRIEGARTLHEDAIKKWLAAQARGAELRASLLRLTTCPKCGWKWDRLKQASEATGDAEVVPLRLDDEIKKLDVAELEWRETVERCLKELDELGAIEQQTTVDVARLSREKEEAEARFGTAVRDYVRQQQQGAIVEYGNARLEGWRQTESKLVSERETLEQTLKALKDELDAARSSQTAAMVRLDTIFDGVIRALVDVDATGIVRLRKQNIECVTCLGGLRRSAAIDALNVIAFDIAAMVLAGSGHATLPTWLLHDSPRTADLAATNYGRLFDLIVRLEKAAGGDPWFQYIITTTTSPPTQFCGDDYVMLRLNGAAPMQRLLMTEESGQAA